MSSFFFYCPYGALENHYSGYFSVQKTGAPRLVLSLSAGIARQHSAARRRHNDLGTVAIGAAATHLLCPVPPFIFFRPVHATFDTHSAARFLCSLGLGLVHRLRSPGKTADSAALNTQPMTVKPSNCSVAASRLNIWSSFGHRTNGLPAGNWQFQHRDTSFSSFTCHLTHIIHPRPCPNAWAAARRRPERR